MQAIPIILGCLLLAGVLFAGGAALRSSNAGPRKKELVAARRTMVELEQYAVERMQIDPQDLTAYQVATIIRNNRQKELS